jgi:eukaryotic-like serine/threonine-protein kinase
MESMHPGVPETHERRLGRYSLHGEIASGGMATVHFGRLAGEGGFSRIVAIKCMHRHLADDPEFRAMFLDEARLAARVRHPNVVSTIDVGSSEEGMFLVMEYVTGESLAALLRAATRRGEPVPVSISIRILIDALYGLHAAHVATDDAGAPLHIVHRDVSPQNILVATDGHARVLDFGIAKAAGRSHTTREGQLKGKFRYMAPEQVRDTPVDPRTDVYAASVVLWELLAGQPLFRGSNDAAIVARVLEGVVAPPSKLTPSLPPELDAIVMRGLEREPEKRFASAEAMAEALETLSHSTTARQVGIWVEHLAGDVLRARAEKIASFEGMPSTSGIVRAAPVAPNTPEPRTGTATLTLPQPEPKTQVSVAKAPDRGVAPPGRRGVPMLAMVLGTTVIGILAGLAFVGTRGSHPEATPAAASSASAAPIPTASDVEPAPTSTASVAEEPADQPSAATSTPTPVAASAARTHRPPRGSQGAPAKPNCSPPYYQDPSGIRHVKPECL